MSFPVRAAALSSFLSLVCRGNMMLSVYRQPVGVF